MTAKTLVFAIYLSIFGSITYLSIIYYNSIIVYLLDLSSLYLYLSMIYLSVYHDLSAIVV